MEKKSLRRHVSLILKEHSSAELKALSAETCRMILASQKVQKADIIVAFWPLPDEVDVRPAVRELYRQGKTILLPHVINDSEMELRLYEGEEDLQKGAFGILEPKHKVAADFSVDAIILVPGRAFDTKGNRLGRGKGYYDRFLSEYDDLHTIGVCYPFQVLNEIPCDEHDKKMKDLIWTISK